MSHSRISMELKKQRSKTKEDDEMRSFPQVNTASFISQVQKAHQAAALPEKKVEPSTLAKTLQSMCRR